MSDYSDFLLSLSPSLYWPLDAVGGITDQADAHNGTAAGGISIGGHVATYPPILGSPQSCSNFDGTDDRVDSTYAVYTAGSTRTFMGWAYRDTSTTSDHIFSSTATTAQRCVLGLSTTDDVQFTPCAGAAGYATWTGAWPGNEQWVFWVVVYEDVTFTARLYLDGDLVDGVKTFPSGYNAAGNLRLGTSGATTNPFDGKMGHIAIVEGGLTAGNIVSLYNYAISGPPVAAFPTTTAPFPSTTAPFYPASGNEVAPTVTTGAESDVSYFSATLNGTVDPNGLQTHYWFEYGLTTAYGSQTPETNTGNGTDPVSVSEPLFGLADNSTYHYRLVAQNGEGTSYGEDGTLTTTDALVPVVVTGAATDITPTSATLNGTVDPESQYTWAWFEYGLTPGFGSTTSAVGVGEGTSPVAVARSVPLEFYWRLYYYRLVAWSAAGTTYGNVVTFRTLMSSESTGVLRVPERA